MGQKIGERQRWAWLAADFTVIAASGTCGYGWQWVLLGSILVTAYYIIVERVVPRGGIAAGLGNIGRGVAYLWMILLAAWVACLADTAFPMVEGFPELGWIMLALAAWSGQKGIAACGRCCGVLCLFLLVLYGTVMVLAAPDVKIENLRLQPGWQELLLAAGLFLIPVAVWYVPGGERPKGTAWGVAWLLPIFAVGLAAVTVGVLSPQFVRRRAVPLYDLAQSISLFGVVERMEPLLSVAMIMGVFALLSGLVSACRVLGNETLSWKWHGPLACLLAGGSMYVVRDMPSAWIGIGNCVVFGIFPMLAHWNDRRRGKPPQ